MKKKIAAISRRDRDAGPGVRLAGSPATPDRREPERRRLAAGSIDWPPPPPPTLTRPPAAASSHRRCSLRAAAAASVRPAAAAAAATDVPLGTCVCVCGRLFSGGKGANGRTRKPPGLDVAVGVK